MSRAGSIGASIIGSTRVEKLWRSRGPKESIGRTWAFRHYLVFRGPLNAVSTWFEWRTEGPNYLWPDDRAWIVATEIDGFSTYVGAPKDCINRILAPPLLEAVPSDVTHRFDGIGDPINDAPR